MFTAAALFAAFCATAGSPGVALQDARQGAPLVPSAIRLSEAAQKAIDAEWLTDEERAALRVFHGVWDDRDLTTPALRAAAMLNAGLWDDPIFTDESVPIELRAEAMLRRGQMRAAIQLLEGDETNRASRIRAEAYEALGAQEAADTAVDEPVRRLQSKTLDDPAELTEGVRALIVRARLQGQPSRDYQSMMDLLARAHQELDRLYWPAILTEATLLMEKDNEQEAVAALHQVLALNPRCAEAWSMLGQIALGSFDFDSVQLAAAALERLNLRHPYALLLLAESSLIQDDPDRALELLQPLLERWPSLLPAKSLLAAAHAKRYDDEALRAAMTEYEKLSPNSPQCYYDVGRHLAFDRQYESAAEMLQEAIRRQPAWPAPQIELGLLELQSGRDDRALAALEVVARLDPFNKRAANSLFLLQELATYEQIESEHFIVRYKPGIDQVMADMMLEPLERIHETVATRFAHEPDRKTVIELMPDHERFAVRITGMPWIHTIAACTGPVIALEVPREGPPNKHLGPFLWTRVIQHEYTHTITLSQTRNRIPHWLTEAAAVSMELAPTDYDTCQMLAREHEAGTLFDLDEINWAFVRPKRPIDRGLAYAQGHWMVQYMNQRYGSSALIRLLEQFFEGARPDAAFQIALGVSREQFYREFLQWAGEQIAAWGLAARPSVTELTDAIRWSDPDLTIAMAASQQARLDAIAQALSDRVGEPAPPGKAGESSRLTADQWPSLVRPPVQISDEILAQWLEAYPDHPDIALLNLQRKIKAAEDAGNPQDSSLVPLLERYAELRPVDPFPHRRLALIALAGNDPSKAIEHLEQLDAREQKSTAFAIELAKQYRAADDLQKAIAKATRALETNPYHAATRELAAGLAVEAGDLDLARQHVFALTLIEPDRPQHIKRLQRIEELLAQKAGGGTN